ncbi:DgyrCDS9956 [Dimorphilus gyrociliatus]|uniref:Protein ARV n=1 Tax=Dimorphilus gyrociliatus TaxID=2664684 RepID=A0A7I8VYV5_9ANNE|nr:DgyrCDS9956 [Dimorphilus gyrociliatus]
MSTIQFRNSSCCVECGAKAKEPFKKFDGNVIKMTYCDECGELVDKYFEYDTVLKILSLLLHKPQGYKHIVLNSRSTGEHEWKLLLVLVLCDAYQRWAILYAKEYSKETEMIFYAALEMNFYYCFVYAMFKWFILNIILSATLFLYDGKPCLDRLTTIMRCMIISSFAKLFAIPALIWAQTQSTNYLALTYLFLLTSNITALKALICEQVSSMFNNL